MKQLKVIVPTYTQLTLWSSCVEYVQAQNSIVHYYCNNKWPCISMALLPNITSCSPIHLFNMLATHLCLPVFVKFFHFPITFIPFLITFFCRLVYLYQISIDN